MLIDCDSCAVRGGACAECVVTVLLGPPGELTAAPPHDCRPGDVVAAASGGTHGGVRLDLTDRRALEVLADAGLVPRLRHQARAAG